MVLEGGVVCGGGEAFVFGRASSLGKSVLGLSGFLSERVAVGGGGQSDVWSQIFADVLGITVHQPEQPIQANARGAAARLFAFGHDAWLLAAYLERLAISSDGRIEGATGTLRIDGFGNVQRTPTWSTFRGGVAVPL
mgnify:CR=1 FL=1